jgi:hypothetical protein
VSAEHLYRLIVASITASATLHSFRLAADSSWRTEGRRRNLDGCQDRSTHCSRLLPKEPLRCGRSVRRREEKVVNGGQAGALSGVIEASKRVMPQRKVPMAPFHIGTPRARGNTTE